MTQKRRPASWRSPSSAPTSAEKLSTGYVLGDVWVREDTDEAYILVDDGAGTWQLLGSGGGGGGSPSGTVVSETTFGLSATAGASATYSRGDHTHGTPTNPVPAHEAAGDPHPGYQLESEKGAANGYASLNGSTLVPNGQLATSGTADGTTFLRGDRTWAAPSGGGLTAAQAAARVWVGV